MPDSFVNRSVTGALSTVFRLTLFWVLVALHGPAGALDVAVNSDVEVETLKLSTLRAIFGMRVLQWPDGTPIKVFVMDSDSEIHSQFAKNRLQVFPYQLQQAWDRLVFSGTGQAPLRAKSIEDMQRRIAETPGSIGYLPGDRLVRGVSKVEVIGQ